MGNSFMDAILIFMWIVSSSFMVCDASTTPAPVTCSSVPSPCRDYQYCTQVGIVAICRNCDASCNGCTGIGNTNCMECQLGYHNESNECRACPDNTFGENCVGTCHCLLGSTDCDQKTGNCEISTQCAVGWTGVPQCQTPCSNNTFGSDCNKQCHCPPDDQCQATNGLCLGGECAVGWSSSGCQNELPQLEDPPTMENVTCAAVTVVWKGWERNTDRGSGDAVIAQYQLYYSYNTVPGNYSAWVAGGVIPHVEGQQEYNQTLSDLVHDANYRFRVDVRQKDGEKLMPRIMEGKVSSDVNILCTLPTTTTTTTPIPGTTARPPGLHLLDETKFTVNFINDSTTLEVRWGLHSNTSIYNISVTFEYHVSSIGDCEAIADPNITSVEVDNNGGYNVTNLLPWRQYFIQVTAENIDSNITDFISRDVSSPEHAPTNSTSSIQVSSVTQNGGTVTWLAPQCQDRGGVLEYYKLDVFLTSPTLIHVHSFTTNETTFILDTLNPHKKYGVSVIYVNARGASSPSVLGQFTTLQDVPGAPIIASVTSDITSVTVTMDPPLESNGVLTEYAVSWSENEQFTNSVSKSQLVEQGNTIVLESLQPNTLYYLKARASTKAGFGNYTNVHNITTLRTASAAPSNVTSDVGARNETCVKVSWNAPEIPNGAVIGFNVTYQEKGSGDDTKQMFFTNSTFATVCELRSGRYYDFQIVTFSDAGYGLPANIQLSTEQADPPVPPTPEVLDTSPTSITVALDPVVIASVTLTYGYNVFVYDKSNSNVQVKRAIGTSNETCPGVDDVVGDIVRNFSQAEIPTRTNFVIGDGKTYGLYENKVLTEDHEYEIYYVITSYFQGICKYSYSQTAAVKAALPVKEPVVTPAPESGSNIILIIIIVVILVLIIIAVVIILICCWLRNRRAEQKYQVYINEKDDFGMKVYTQVDNYDPHKYWNTVYSLRESRYIVAGKEFLPDEDKHLMNGSAIGAGNMGPPISFHDEFKNLPHVRAAPCNVAKQRDNELKNRFNHLLPYDHSRIILDPDINDEGDYINANFIKGYKHQRAYIAAQSPFEQDTVLDFWRMIYQYEVRVIVMMANIVEDNIVKCTQYWPSDGRVIYGQFILDLVDVQEYADYFIRTVKVRTTEDKDWQVVYIFDLSYWPEHGVPDDPIPLLEMREKVNVYHKGQTSPIVVHCATGVSRTAVYIALDSLLEQYKAEGRISVFSFVRKMRKDRPAMVRTFKQYVFIYEAIFEAMVAGYTRAGFDLKDMYHFLTKRNKSNGHSHLHGQFRCLQEFTRKLYPATCSNALIPANVNKNRFCEIVPPDLYRPILTTPGGMGRTDYVNAVFLDSHRRFNHYIQTQTPLHTTVIDFWKLVYDHNVHTIIMMEPMMYDDDTCAEYWPEDHKKQFEPFFVESTDVYQQENITIRNLKLVCMNNPKDIRHIRQFQFNAWSDSEFIPKSKSMLLDVMDLVKDWQVVNNNEETPILVHCKDGATHSGLFIAVSVLCEKFQDEGEVDVFHTVKHLKRRRTQIVDILDQYRFCYKALWDYINMRMPGGTLTEQMSKTRSDRPYKSLSMTSFSLDEKYIPY